MEATYNPFAILQVEPGVSLETVRSSYRRLARQHHPDMVPEQDRERATSVMAALNAAMAHLERDFDGWRIRVGFAVESPREASMGVLSVEPRLLILSEVNGWAGFITVATPFGESRQIALRYKSGPIVVEKLPVGSRGVANFRVRVTPKLHVLEQAERLDVELVAPAHKTVMVTVAVEPFGEHSSNGPRASSLPSLWRWLSGRL